MNSSPAELAVDPSNMKEQKLQTKGICYPEPAFFFFFFYVSCKSSRTKIAFIVKIHVTSAPHPILLSYILKFVNVLWVCWQRGCFPLKLSGLEMMPQPCLMKSGTLTSLCVSGYGVQAIDRLQS